jgi:hypothetical protein
VVAAMSANSGNNNNTLARRERRGKLFRYKFPTTGTFLQRIERVSPDVRRYFEALQAENNTNSVSPEETAWRILKSAGFPLRNNTGERLTTKVPIDQFDWEQLLRDASALKLTDRQNKTIRLILLMLMLNPNSNSRLQGRRAKLFSSQQLHYKNNVVPVAIRGILNTRRVANSNFLNKLNKLNSVNKAVGLFGALGGAVRGVAGGVVWAGMSVAERTGLTKLMGKLKPIVTQELKALAQNAFQTLIAPRPNGRPPNFAAVWERSKKRMANQSKQLAVGMTADFTKSLVGNNPQVKMLVNIAMPTLVESAKLKIEKALKASGQVKSPQELEQMIAAEVAAETKNVVENAKAKVASKSNINRKVNTAVELYTRQQAAIGTVNYANVAQYKNKIRQQIINGTFDPNAAAKQYNIKTVKGQKMGLAIAASVLGIESIISQVQKFKAAQNSLSTAKQAWNTATEVARKKQGEALLKKRAINAVENAAQKAAARAAAFNATQAAKQAVNKAALLKPAVNKATSALQTAQSGATKMAQNKLKLALEHVAGQGIVPPNSANKLVRIFGGNARVATALQNPNMAKNLLQNLASLKVGF